VGLDESARGMKRARRRMPKTTGSASRSDMAVGSAAPACRATRHGSRLAGARPSFERHRRALAGTCPSFERHRRGLAGTRPSFGKTPPQPRRRPPVFRKHIDAASPAPACHLERHRRSLAGTGLSFGRTPAQPRRHWPVIWKDTAAPSPAQGRLS
jgi:hypothetical protein